MSGKSTAHNVGTSPMFLLFLVFLVLKLTNVVAWSWWLVTAPLWVGALLFVAVVVIGVAEKKEKASDNNPFRN